MWKLKLTQKIKSNTSDFVFENTVELVHEDLEYIVNMVQLLVKGEGDRETFYKIEKVKEGE